MTDARFPDRWLADRRIQRLTDRGFRAFVSALMWSVLNRTDGVIEHEDLALIPGFANCAEDELAAAGLFEPLDHGWLITEYARTQTSKDALETLERARAANRERQAKWRAERANARNNVTNGVTNDVTNSVTPQARLGKARLGALPSPLPENNSCPDCEGSGWVVDTDPAVKCACRRRIAP